MKEKVFDDCEYYNRGECKILVELVCEKRKCSFYKPKKKGEENEKKGKQT